MSTEPIISIIIPSYNHAAYIGEAIESLLGQTFSDFELIIVDDGSSDGSPELIKRYADQDSRIIPIFQANQGPSAAVNRGLKIAAGRFITCHPSDDRSHTNRLEALITYLNSHHECDLVGSYIEEIDSNGAIVSNNHKFESWFNVEKDFSDPKTWVWENRVVSPTLMFRRTFFERYGDFDPDLIYTQDCEILVRSISMGAKLQILPLKLFQYRSHSDNLTNKNTHEVFHESAYISSKTLIPWLVKENHHQGVFNNVYGFVTHPLFKPLSNPGRINLLSLLVGGFGTSYTDFCLSLVSAADKTIEGGQSHLRKFSDFFNLYLMGAGAQILTLQENNQWLKGQREAWEKLAAEREQTIHMLLSQQQEIYKKLAEKEAILYKICNHWLIRLINFLSLKKLF